MLSGIVVIHRLHCRHNSCWLQFARKQVQNLPADWKWRHQLLLVDRKLRFFLSLLSRDVLINVKPIFSPNAERRFCLMWWSPSAGVVRRRPSQSERLVCLTKFDTDIHTHILYNHTGCDVTATSSRYLSKFEKTAEMPTTTASGRIFVARRFVSPNQLMGFLFKKSDRFEKRYIIFHIL